MSYAELAPLYDRIYEWKDYEGEARTLRDLLSSHGVPDGGHLLEAACGTGAYLEQLDAWYEVAGFDIDPSMLEVARRKLPETPLKRADMRDLETARSYDAVVCLFSSIGHLSGPDELAATAVRMRRTLEPGGVAVIEPWIQPGEMIEGHVSMDTWSGDALEVCRQSYNERKGRTSSLTFEWLVAREGEGIEHVVQPMELYMFTREEYRTAMDEAGFDVSYDEVGLMGRGLYVGVAT